MLTIFFDIDSKIKLDPLLPIDDEELAQIKKDLNKTIEVYVIRDLEGSIEKKICSLIIKYYQEWEKLNKMKKELKAKKEKILEDSIKEFLRKNKTDKIKEYNSKNIAVF